MLGTLANACIKLVEFFICCCSRSACRTGQGGQLQIFVGVGHCVQRHLVPCGVVYGCTHNAHTPCDGCRVQPFFHHCVYPTLALFTACVRQTLTHDMRGQG